MTGVQTCALPICVLSVVIGDNGVGMTREQLRGLRRQLERREGRSAGIGLGNIYRRIGVNYPGSRFVIYSRKDVGTVIRITLPQR